MNRFYKIGFVNLLFLFFFYQKGKSQQSITSFPDDTSTIAVIDGMKISKKEFEWRMNGFRSACFDFFLQKYNATYNEKDFWNHSFDSITPFQWIKEKTLQQLKIEKVKIKLMQRYGLLKGYNYEQFLMTYKEENEKRKAMVEKGQVIYGLQQFDENSYHEYILSNALLETQRRMLVNKPLSEKYLRDYYELVKKEKFNIPPTITVAYVMMDKNKKQELKYKELHALVKAKNKKVIAALQNMEYKAAISVQDIILYPAGRKTDELKWGNMFQQAILLKKEGAISNLFSDGNGNDCFLICKKIIDNGWLPFKEVRENVKTQIAENRFKQMLNSSLSKVTVKKNTYGWGRLNIE